jgi:AraC-like DNA-binding protein
LRSDLSCRAPLLDDLLVSHLVDNGRHLRYGGGGARTDLLCGGFEIDDREVHPMLVALSPVLHIHGQSEHPADWLETILHLLQHEMASWSPGAEAVVTRLTDVLLTQAIRRSHPGLDGFGSPRLGALRDPQIAAAMRLIHDQPEHAWTASDLAARVAMSRSAFSTRFRLITGEAPMRYLTRYRLARAADYLRTSSESLFGIALQTGYASDVSLSKAFKRYFGMAPGDYRKIAQSRVPTRM